MLTSFSDIFFRAQYHVSTSSEHVSIKQLLYNDTDKKRNYPVNQTRLFHIIK